MKRLLQTAAIAASLVTVSMANAAEPIRITHVNSLTGALEAYGKQTSVGLKMGFEYATNGTMEIDGRPIEIRTVDDQLNPARARSLVEEAYAEHDAHIVIGPIASGIALAALPIAEEYERIIIPQGVADAITGANHNRYVFRITRNSQQDAISNAVAVAGEGVCVSTIAQDYAFGRDGVAAYKDAFIAEGGTVVHEEYLPADATDFTAAAQRLFDSLRNREDCAEGNRYIFAIWAGGSGPLPRIQDLQPGRFGISLTTGGNILPVLATYKQFPGMEGATYYYYENPQNEINDWFVENHFARENAPPDFFTAQGFSEAMGITAAIRKANGSTDVEDLIEAFRGLDFDTPKGPMHIRAEDHQTLQSMYHFKIRVDPNVDWAIPELVREITKEEMDIPVLN